MMAKGNNKVQEPEKTVQKIGKPRVKKDAVPNPPGQDKVKKKKKKNSPKKNVPNLLDRIRHPQPQKGLQQHLLLFLRCYGYCNVRFWIIPIIFT